jgi:putative membrane protein
VSVNKIKALLMLALSLYLGVTILSGRLYFYIGPRTAWIAVLSVGLLLLPAAAYLVRLRAATDHEHHTSAWTLLLVALPLALGLLVPPRPLGASSIATRGFANDAALSSDAGAGSASISAEQRNVLDWVRAIHANSDPHALDGQPVDVVGFVYRDAQFGDNQFMVARLTVVCCVADAAAIGLVVQSPSAGQLAASSRAHGGAEGVVPSAAQLTPDSWVQVKGQFTAGSLDGRPTPVVAASEIVPIEPPQQPYLYP